MAQERKAKEYGVAAAICGFSQTEKTLIFRFKNTD